MLRRHSTTQGEGTVHFVTTVTKRRGRWFVADPVCHRLLEVFEFYCAKFDLACYGYVLMPDHLHVLVLQTKDEAPVSAWMRDCKHYSSREIRAWCGPDCGGWRNGFDDVLVAGHDAIRTKLHYMHENPTRKHLAELPEEYTWSSAGFYMQQRESIVQLTYNPH